MWKPIFSILVIVFAFSCFGECQEMTMRELRRKLGDNALMRSGTHDRCDIEKPTDKCIGGGPPTCETKTCRYVPEYGEEITSVWQLFLDGYSSLFQHQKKKKYRRILDLGERVTKSFPAEVCENENTICDCDSADPLCSCHNTDDLKVCRQKFTNKFSLYYVYNFFFCEPEVDPWAIFFKKLIGAEPRHLSYIDHNSPPYYPPYNPFSQTPSFDSLFKYISLIKKEKHQHISGLVLCAASEQATAASPQHSLFHGFPYGESYFKKPAYMLDPYTIVRHAFLKVKVPNGCECDDYEKTSEDRTKSSPSLEP